MRPIFWGLIATAVGVFFWLLFSIFAVVEMEYYGLTNVGLLYVVLVYISGYVMLFSLPVSIIIEVYRWLKRRRGRTA